MKTTFAVGDTVTVTSHLVNERGADAHGQTGTVVAVPGPRPPAFYSVRIEGWPIPALLRAGELRRT